MVLPHKLLMTGIPQSVSESWAGENLLWVDAMPRTGGTLLTGY